MWSYSCLSSTSSNQALGGTRYDVPRPRRKAFCTLLSFVVDNLTMENRSCIVPLQRSSWKKPILTFLMNTRNRFYYQSTTSGRLHYRIEVSFLRNKFWGRPRDSGVLLKFSTAAASVAKSIQQFRYPNAVDREYENGLRKSELELQSWTLPSASENRLKSIRVVASGKRIVSTMSTRISVFLQTFCNIKHLTIAGNIQSCWASIILHVHIDSIEVIQQHGNNVQSAAEGSPKKSSATKWTSNVHNNALAKQHFNNIPLATATRHVQGLCSLFYLMHSHPPFHVSPMHGQHHNGFKCSPTSGQYDHLYSLRSHPSCRILTIREPYPNYRYRPRLLIIKAVSSSKLILAFTSRWSNFTNLWTTPKLHAHIKAVKSFIS